MTDQTMQEQQGVQQEHANQPVQQEHKQESEADRNWKLMRERAENAERRIQELERYFKDAEERNQKQNMVREEEPEEEYSDPDAFVDRKGLRRELTAREKKLREELEEQRKRLEQMTVQSAEQRLYDRYKDFDDVVNDDNMNKLAKMKPSAYRAIYASEDIFDRGELAYDLLTTYGIAKRKDELDEKLQQNQQKPRSAATVAPQTADTPLSRIGDFDRRNLTEERKAQLRRQVAEAKRYR